MTKKKILKIQITKLSAALRQLETAITIWFNQGDSISIHTLVSASYQILYDLNKHQKGHQMTPDSEFIKQEKLKDWKKALKSAANFMKHADSDPNKVLSFSPQINEYLLFDATTTYANITTESTPILKCFFLWMIIFHPTLFLKEYIERFNKSIVIEELTGMNRTEFFKNMLPVVTSNIIDDHLHPL